MATRRVYVKHYYFLHSHDIIWIVESLISIDVLILKYLFLIIFASDMTTTVIWHICGILNLLFLLNISLLSLSLKFISSFYHSPNCLPLTLPWTLSLISILHFLIQFLQVISTSTIPITDINSYILHIQHQKQLCMCSNILSYIYNGARNCGANQSEKQRAKDLKHDLSVIQHSVSECISSKKNIVKFYCCHIQHQNEWDIFQTLHITILIYKHLIQEQHFYMRVTSAGQYLRQLVLQFYLSQDKILYLELPSVSACNTQLSIVVTV